MAVVSPADRVGSAPGERPKPSDERAIGIVPAGPALASADAAGAGAARHPPRRFAPDWHWPETGAKG